ncbi:MAG: putative toxin-antitoxin system toxin component, PIN family [Nanoarchaeota archaeon]
MKITADTNVLISGTFWEGDSFRILEKVKKKEITLFLSEEILSEYEKVLSYSEIKDKIQDNDLEIKKTMRHRTFQGAV